MPLWYETQQELDSAVEDLHKLGPAAKKLLQEVVEHTTVQRTRPSPSAHALCNAGFLHIRELTEWDDSVEYMASLWGEEALEALEERDFAAAAPSSARQRRPAADTRGSL